MKRTATLEDVEHHRRLLVALLASERRKAFAAEEQVRALEADNERLRGELQALRSTTQETPR